MRRDNRSGLSDVSIASSPKTTLRKPHPRDMARAHPQHQALRWLHQEVIGLKNHVWEYVTRYAYTRFVGGQPLDTLALRSEVRQMAKSVAEGGTRLQSDVARHLVKAFANSAQALCEVDALSAVTAVVRVHELYLAAEPELTRLIEEWTLCWPMDGLPGIDLDGASE